MYHILYNVMKKNMGEALKKDGTNQTSEGIILIQGAYEEILKKQDQEFKERRECGSESRRIRQRVKVSY